MTLIIAADVQDHLILAGDHCAMVSQVSNRGERNVVLDNYQKLYPWEYGGIAGSGDVFLMMQFQRLFIESRTRGQPVDLVDIARRAKQLRVQLGHSASQVVGNIFCTLPAEGDFSVHAVYVGVNRIEYERLTPIAARFSMPGAPPDSSRCDLFTKGLRPSFDFADRGAFHAYHLDLLSDFFAAQSAEDPLVTSTFDVMMLEKRTGQGFFWKTPDRIKPLLSLCLESDVLGDVRAAEIAAPA